MNGSARTIVCISSLVLAAGTASARPASELHQLAPTETDVDVIGDAAGRKVPTGVYLYRLDAGGIPLTKKMVLMK